MRRLRQRRGRPTRRGGRLSWSGFVVKGAITITPCGIIFYEVPCRYPLLRIPVRMWRQCPQLRLELLSAAVLGDQSDHSPCCDRGTSRHNSTEDVIGSHLEYFLPSCGRGHSCRRDSQPATHTTSIMMSAISQLNVGAPLPLHNNHNFVQGRCFPEEHRL